MTFYITTPIYYVNDTPHIGHAYTTIVADVLTRYHRLFGEESLFLTGTDEHGQKVQNAAKARGLDPQVHVDEMMEQFKSIWGELDVQYDIFMRTSFPYHKEVVQKCLKDLFDRGEIYSAEYEGWYSVSEEIFYMEKDLINGKSPMGKEVTKITEKNYFFKMSKYQDRLIQYIEEHPDFVRPEGKRSEVLGFLQKPLEDLCISRPKTRLSWGIELPFDRDYVTYVWFDALLNYASAIGYQQGGAKEAIFKKWWPHVVHLIGKDILTTHTVYWPTMLMALGVPLPKTVFAHGWWLTDSGGKMSKSEGPVVSPLEMRNIVGVDPFRYFLTRDIYLGNDARFSKELVISRINTELANNLGNLLSRTLNLVHKFFEGKVPPADQSLAETKELIKQALGLPTAVKTRIEAMEPNLAIEEVVNLLTATNRFIDTIAPWKTAKENLPVAGECLYTCLEILRISAILLSPVMPQKMAELLAQLGLNANPNYSETTFGGLQSGVPVPVPSPLFPRIG